MDRAAEGAKWKRPEMVLEVGNQVEESGWGDNELLDAEIRGEIPEMQRALEIKLHNSQDTLLRLSNGTMVLFRLQIFITGHCSTFCLYLTNFVRSWTN